MWVSVRRGLSAERLHKPISTLRAEGRTARAWCHRFSLAFRALEVAMVPSKEDYADLSPENSAQVDAVVDRFEEAWQRGQRPAVDTYLPPAGPLRRAVLINLVHVDLERRLEAGEAARVETYLERYAELGEDPTAVAGLVAAEYELRRRRNPEVTPDEYFQRFPRYGEQLRAGLGLLPFQTMQT